MEEAVKAPVKVLVISECWPFIAGASRGVEVALYEILRLLASEQGFSVSYVLAEHDALPISPAARSGMDDLEVVGVRFIRPVHFDKSTPSSFFYRNYRRLFGDDLIPGLGQQDAVIARCKSENAVPDIVVSVWSDVATAAASRLPWPVFSYSGNPLHKVMLANLRFQWHWERRLRPSWLMRQAFLRIVQKIVERKHIGYMRRIACVGDVHANDTDYYRSVGVNALYLRSMWPSSGNANWAVRRDACEQLSPLKIAASVGTVPSTGNTFGLWALGKEILPALNRRIGAGGFELHVYGAGKPRPALNTILRDPAIKLRGFVDDIDSEIYSSPIYLVANNRYCYKAGHNRFLHAWSLGACVVTWRDSALAMPELVHGENALLADTAEEMAEFISRAAADVGLRRRLGEAGRSAVLKYYQPELVVAELARKLREGKTAPSPQ